MLAAATKISRQRPRNHPATAALKERGGGDTHRTAVSRRAQRYYREFVDPGQPSGLTAAERHAAALRVANIRHCSPLAKAHRDELSRLTPAHGSPAAATSRNAAIVADLLRLTAILAFTDAIAKRPTGNPPQTSVGPRSVRPDHRGHRGTLQPRCLHRLSSRTVRLQRRHRPPLTPRRRYGLHGNKPARRSSLLISGALEKQIPIATSRPPNAFEQTEFSLEHSRRNAQFRSNRLSEQAKDWIAVSRLRPSRGYPS